MIQPISFTKFHNKPSVLFKNNTDAIKQTIVPEDNNSDTLLLEYIKDKEDDKQNKKYKTYLMTFSILLAGIGAAFCIPKLMSKASRKITHDTALEFYSLSGDKKIPTLDTCNSINPQLKNFLQNQVDYARASQDVLKKAGNPDADKRLLLYGEPGSGKSFFSKIFAKTLNADYMEIKYSDINKRFCGEHIENMRLIFDNAIKTAQKNPDKKFVINFNEIDALAVPIEQLNGPYHSAFKKEERTTFLIFLEEAAEKAPNLIIIGSSNTTPGKGLDGAVLSRFQNVMEVQYPNKELIYEALLAHIRTLPEGNSFIEKNKTEIENFSQTLYTRDASFRNLDNIVNESKNIYLRELLKNNNSEYQIDYLQQALKSISMTDGEISKNKKSYCK